MSKLIIIRGPSGTGKSTIARHLGGIATINWFEADMFFTDPFTGDYAFNRHKLGEAHRWCLENTRNAMSEGQEFVIVSNTFIKLRDMYPYLDDYVLCESDEIEIIRTPGFPWHGMLDMLDARNVHGVPRETLERFIYGFQEHPRDTDWVNMEIFK